MFKLEDKIKTGEDFLSHLASLYGRGQLHSKVVDFAQEAWDEWEKNGTSKPDDVKSVAEDPLHTYRVYYRDILSVCNIQNVDSSSVFFSLLLIKNLNAYATTTGNKDKVIVFDENLVTFFTALIISIMVANYTDPSDSELEVFDDFIFTNFDDFFNRSNPNVSKKNEEYRSTFMKIIKRDYKFTEIGSYFSMAFTVFIICHEVSHHILGHSIKKRMYSVPNNNNEFEIPLNTPSHEEEFEADLHGYKLFLELIDNNDQAEVAIIQQAFNRAPLMFFEILDLAQLYSENKIGSSFKSESHPSPKVRKQKMLDFYEVDLHGHGLELYNGFMNYSARLRKKIAMT